eukprot:TRINITY_DN25815_c0_g1_i1.p1 TRINITY_DN25815_c0_g1~~TRINITY_DN25815_c0_g1_i1.p1  ORF type:complete len:485 (+),score=40.03 TRINITY_DN25815_c0_g1_i1:66-1520(+)
MDVARQLGRSGVQAVAPSWMQFSRDTRRVKGGATRRMGAQTMSDSGGTASWHLIVCAIISACSCLFSAWKERRLLRHSTLASETPLSSLADIQCKLRKKRGNSDEDSAPSSGQTLPHNVGVSEESVQRVSVITVLDMTGSIILGPISFDLTTCVIDLTREVADVLGRHPHEVVLLSGDQKLHPQDSFAELGFLDEMQLSALVSDRQEIADALFVRVAGTLTVLGNSWVTAPFSGQNVLFYEATRIRLFDRWVTKTYKKCVKNGRAASDNDPGSDSEYEEATYSCWEPHEEILTQATVVAPRIYLDDGSGQLALVEPRDAVQWARENSSETFCQTVPPAPTDLGLGTVLVAMVSTERETGQRHLEKCLRLGERAEIVGEAVVTDLGMVLREPSLPSASLHRVHSAGDVAPSSLPNKAFVGAVLRAHLSLESLQQQRAWKWSLGKWFSGLITAAIAVYVLLRKRRRRALGQLAASVPVRPDRAHPF